MNDVASTIPTTSAMDKFKANVIREMEHRGLSITDVAINAGLTRPSLSAMLNGRGGNCSLATAEKIAVSIGCNLYELLK
jgi:DNA-binding Xre family transcriptional regulator